MSKAIPRTRTARLAMTAGFTSTFLRRHHLPRSFVQAVRNADRLARRNKRPTVVRILAEHFVIVARPGEDSIDLLAMDTAEFYVCDYPRPEWDIRST